MAYSTRALALDYPECFTIGGEQSLAESIYSRGSQPFLACGPLEALYYFLQTPQFNNMILKLLNVDPPAKWTPVGNP